MNGKAVSGRSNNQEQRGEQQSFQRPDLPGHASFGQVSIISNGRRLISGWEGSVRLTS
jgi:hypothetical protein